ncbi:hypothetical protein CDD83_3106 [Cordyceps sp. RAO-2017]|nr:hypothetical protein CDD83_3106 [Cordyceps sp. RAO-2017]
MARLDATAITLAPGTEPFALAPVIEDLIRTRFCVPGSVFLVEGIDTAPVTDSGRWQAIRILLGDGELCIEALLEGALHRFVQTGEVTVGCYVRLQQFEIRWRDAPEDTDSESDGGGDADKMAFLVLRDLVTIGWNATVRALHASEAAATANSPLPEEQREALGDALEAVAVAVRKTEARLEAKREPGRVPEPGPQPQPQPARTAPDVSKALDAIKGQDAEADDVFESFEALTFPGKKRRVGRDPRSLPAPQDMTTTATTTTTTTTATGKAPLPIALPKDWHDPQMPLKLTILRSIPHLPYAQNWSCNVLAIVASLSEVEPSQLPPYKQRTARIADPSTAKQVHLTVFLDPDEFAPKVGSAVLLTGVKNHRFDGGSLKKYASDGRRGGARWWFEEPWELTWCDVAGIKQWWADMEAARAV